MLAFGAWQFPSMDVDVLPEFTPTTVLVQTEALGLSAVEVEQLITVPLEQDLLNGVAWLHTIRSQSVPGLSSIELIFEPGTPLFRARQVVQERLTQAHALPQVSKPPQMLQPLSSTSRVMMVGLTSEELSSIEMSVLARWNIRPKLIGVPGVANVAIFGQRERQLQVLVDPLKLQAQGVSLDQVISTAGNALWVSPLTFLKASTPGTGGFIDTPNQRLGVQHISPINSAEEFGQVIVDDTEGRPLQLKDVASVVEDHQPLIGDAVFANGDNGLLLVIEKFPGANTADVTKAIDQAFEDLKPGMAGVDVDRFVYRPANYVSDAVNNLTVALVAGAVLALLVLLGLFLELRATLISAATVTATVVAGGLVLYVRDVTLNAMVLAGLVLGLIIVVDDAVSGSLGVIRRLRENGNGHNERTTIATLVRDAVFDQRGPLLYATVFAALMLVPLLFMEGLSGESFFPPAALSFMLAAVVSAVVAMTVAPALASLLYGRSAMRPTSPRMVGMLERGWDGLVSRTPRPRILAGVGVVALLAIGAATLTQLRADVVPDFDETDLVVKLEAAPGSSLPEVSRLASLISEELRSVQGVSKVGGHVGRAITSDQVVSVNAGELWVRIGSGRDYAATRRRIDTVLAGYPGISHEVTTYADQRLREVLSPTDAPVQVRVFGEVQSVLQAKAAEVKALLDDIDGVDDARIDTAPVEPTLAVKVDLDAAQALGIKPGEVRRAAATLLQGIVVGELFEEQKVFEVVVRGVPETRNSAFALEEFLLDSPQGGQVRLGEVADVQISSTPTVINRDASSRALDVIASVDGRDRDEIASEIEDRLGEIYFPLSYHAELVGDFGERKAAERRVALVAGGVAIGALLVLQAAFNTWRVALLVLALLPASLVGGLVTARIDGESLTLGSMLGLLGVLALAARGAVLFIREAQHLEATMPDGRDPALVLRAARERVGPTLIGATATAAALAPMLVLGGLPGHELVTPLAVVVLGALVSMSIVNLFVLPLLYLAVRPKRQPKPLFEDGTITVLEDAEAKLETTTGSVTHA